VIGRVEIRPGSFGRGTGQIFYKSRLIEVRAERLRKISIRQLAEQGIIFVAAAPFFLVLFVGIFLLCQFFAQLAPAIAVHDRLVPVDTKPGIGSSVEIVISYSDVPAHRLCEK